MKRASTVRPVPRRTTINGPAVLALAVLALAVGVTSLDLLLTVTGALPQRLLGDLAQAFAPPLTGCPAAAGCHVLGTDAQGRDFLWLLVRGVGLSLSTAVAAVALTIVIGMVVGLIAGFRGGWFDSLAMRLAEAQQAVPAILLAMLFLGIARSVLPLELQDLARFWVLVGAIALARWPHFAPAVRTLVLREKGKLYVEAAIAVGVGPVRLLARHIVPNIMPPLVVIASADLALAITAEATLSFLGIGLSPASPSLGTLVRIGQQFMVSGEWWLLVLPAAALVALTLAAHVLADRLAGVADESSSTRPT